jgi:hypothetical protein
MGKKNSKGHSQNRDNKYKAYKANGTREKNKAIRMERRERALERLRLKKVDKAVDRVFNEYGGALKKLGEV